MGPFSVSIGGDQGRQMRTDLVESLEAMQASEAIPEDARLAASALYGILQPPTEGHSDV